MYKVDLGMVYFSLSLVTHSLLILFTWKIEGIMKIVVFLLIRNLDSFKYSLMVDGIFYCFPFCTFEK